MKKKVIIFGASGFLARNLIQHLSKNKEFELFANSRKEVCYTVASYTYWDGFSLSKQWTALFEGAHAVINLTGQSIDCRFTKKNRSLLLNSRLQTTKIISKAIAECSKPPSLWLNASGDMIYPHNSSTALDEEHKDFYPSTQINDEFLFELSQKWEKACLEQELKQTHRVILRISAVFANEKHNIFNHLKKAILKGFGGSILKGNQLISWIHITDLCRSIEFILQKKSPKVIYNLCSPSIDTNKNFMADFRKILNKSLALPIPFKSLLELICFLVKKESVLMLKSIHTLPKNLLESGFKFHYNSAKKMLEDLNKN